MGFGLSMLQHIAYDEQRARVHRNCSMLEQSYLQLHISAMTATLAQSKHDKKARFVPTDAVVRGASCRSLVIVVS